MSSIFSPMPGPGAGVFPGEYDPPLFKNVTASAMTLGTVVMLDLQQSDSDTVSIEFGHANSSTGSPDGWANCIVLPDAAGIRANIQLVVTEPNGIAAGASGRCAVFGSFSTVKVDGSGTTATKGCALIANTSGKLVIAPATGAAEKIVGYLQSTSSVTTDTTARVWFNGLGWAQHRDN